MVSLFFKSIKEVHLLSTTSATSVFLWCMSLAFVIEYTKNKLLVLISTFFLLIWTSCLLVTIYKIYRIYKLKRKRYESALAKSATTTSTVGSSVEPPAICVTRPLLGSSSMTQNGNQQQQRSGPPPTSPISITCVYNMLTVSYVSTLWSSLIIGANLFLSVVIYIDATREYAPAVYGAAVPSGADLKKEAQDNNADPTFLTKHIVIPLIVYIASIVAWMCSIIFGSLLCTPLDEDDDYMDDTGSASSGSPPPPQLRLNPPQRNKQYESETPQFSLQSQQKEPTTVVNQQHATRSVTMRSPGYDMPVSDSSTTVNTSDSIENQQQYDRNNRVVVLQDHPHAHAVVSFASQVKTTASDVSYCEDSAESRNHRHGVDTLKPPILKYKPGADGSVNDHRDNKGDSSIPRDTSFLSIDSSGSVSCPSSTVNFSFTIPTSQTL